MMTEAHDEEQVGSDRDGRSHGGWSRRIGAQRQEQLDGRTKTSDLGNTREKEWKSDEHPIAIEDEVAAKEASKPGRPPGREIEASRLAEVEASTPRLVPGGGKGFRAVVLWAFRQDLEEGLVGELLVLLFERRQLSRLQIGRIEPNLRGHPTRAEPRAATTRDGAPFHPVRQPTSPSMVSGIGESRSTRRLTHHEMSPSPVRTSSNTPTSPSVATQALAEGVWRRRFGETGVTVAPGRPFFGRSADNAFRSPASTRRRSKRGAGGSGRWWREEGRASSLESGHAN